MNQSLDQQALANALHLRLESLRQKYPNYSLRAFAKKAGLSPATMSLILQGKRKISQKLAMQLSERLIFDPQEQSEILKLFAQKTPDPVLRKSAQYVRMNQDQFEVISDWRAFAVLNLIKTKDFSSSPKWIAGRLGLEISETRETISRLKRLKMLEVDGQGELRRTNHQYKTTEDIASIALRRSHAQTLDLAAQSLERDAVELRDFTWITMPADLSRMEDAKVAIRKFQDEMSEILEDAPAPTEVYRLAIQLFPLTQVSKPVAASNSISKLSKPIPKSNSSLTSPKITPSKKALPKKVTPS